MRDLPGVEIIPQQLRIVVAHFFKMRNEPVFVDRVAMEAAGELVVNAAAGHFLEGGFSNGEEMFVFFRSGRRAADGLLIALED